MTIRTVKKSSFEAYLALDFPSSCSEDTLHARDAVIEDRNRLLSKFPFAIVLELSYAELDFANRFCWEKFGPADGECLQSYSEYPVCNLKVPHSHHGRWANYWHAKTEYDFGFNEWYFRDKSDFELFEMNIENINWGENFPK